MRCSVTIFCHSIYNLFYLFSEPTTTPPPKPSNQPVTVTSTASTSSTQSTTAQTTAQITVSAMRQGEKVLSLKPNAAK